MNWLWRKLGVVPQDEMTGLQIESAGCWEIAASAWDAEVNFAALPTLIDGECTIYLEGGSHSDEVTSFIDKHQVEPQANIARGTIWPRQSVYHLPATLDVFDGLSRLAGHHAVPEICCHLVIYRPPIILVDWYDAFDREIYASSAITERSFREFTEIIGATYRVEVA